MKSLSSKKKLNHLKYLWNAQKKRIFLAKKIIQVEKFRLILHVCGKSVYMRVNAESHGHWQAKIVFVVVIDVARNNYNSPMYIEGAPLNASSNPLVDFLIEHFVFGCELFVEFLIGIKLWSNIQALGEFADFD